MNKLYEKQLKAVLNKQHDKIVTLSDGLGLGARVSLRGKVSWQYRYKIDGKNKRLDFGHYPALSLKQARELAQECREWIAQGYDPKLQKQLQREAMLKPVTVKDALEYWLVEYAESHRANFEKHRAQFARHIYPYIGNFPLADTETRHWLECFDRIKKGIPSKQKAAPVAAAYIFGNAKQALRFCRVRRYATSRELDDLTGTDVGSKQRKKDRVLSDAELGQLWATIETRTFNSYMDQLLKMLIVFGARTQEVRLSAWTEWDFKANIWTVPKAHSKTGTKILRPIPNAFKPWLLNLKSRSKEGDYILGQLKSNANVSGAGGQLWKRLGHTEEWTLHDIRRSLATKMNDLHVAPHIVEHLLGHTVGGSMLNYNYSQYLTEKEQALDMWFDRLELLANPSENVLILKA